MYITVRIFIYVYNPVESKSFCNIETASFRLSYSSAREARVPRSFRHRDCPISDAERHWTIWKISRASWTPLISFTSWTPNCLCVLSLCRAFNWSARFAIWNRHFVISLRWSLCLWKRFSEELLIWKTKKLEFRIGCFRQFQPCSNVKSFGVQHIPYMRAEKIVERTKDVFSYGPYKGKINLNIWEKLKDKPNGTLTTSWCGNLQCKISGICMAACLRSKDTTSWFAESTRHPWGRENLPRLWGFHKPWVHSSGRRHGAHGAETDQQTQQTQQHHVNVINVVWAFCFF